VKNPEVDGTGLLGCETGAGGANLIRCEVAYDPKDSRSFHQARVAIIDASAQGRLLDRYQEQLTVLAERAASGDPGLNHPPPQNIDVLADFEAWKGLRQKVDMCQKSHLYDLVLEALERDNFVGYDANDNRIPNEKVAHGIVYGAIQGALHFGDPRYASYVEALYASFGIRRGRGAYTGSFIKHVNDNSAELVELMMTNAFKHLFNLNTRKRLRRYFQTDHIKSTMVDAAANFILMFGSINGSYNFMSWVNVKREFVGEEVWAAVEYFVVQAIAFLDEFGA